MRRCRYLPEDKPRYLMGVGTPEEIVHYVAQGVDMMDCVLPTRAARHGLLFTSEGRRPSRTRVMRPTKAPLDPQLRLPGLRAAIRGPICATCTPLTNCWHRC